MEDLDSNSDQLVELTKRICKAVEDNDVDFIRRYVSENLILLENTLNFKNRRVFDKNFVFDKFTKPHFQIVASSSRKPIVTWQKNRAKVNFEVPTDFGFAKKRFTFKGGFYRNIFYYSMIGDNWKLVKVEVKLTHFSRNNFSVSWEYLISFFSKYRIYYYRKIKL